MDGISNNTPNNPSRVVLGTGQEITIFPHHTLSHGKTAPSGNHSSHVNLGASEEITIPNTHRTQVNQTVKPNKSLQEIRQVKLDLTFAPRHPDVQQMGHKLELLEEGVRSGDIPHPVVPEVKIPTMQPRQTSYLSTTNIPTQLVEAPSTQPPVTQASHKKSTPPDITAKVESPTTLAKTATVESPAKIINFTNVVPRGVHQELNLQLITENPADNTPEFFEQKALTAKNPLDVAVNYYYAGSAASQAGQKELTKEFCRKSADAYYEAAQQPSQEDTLNLLTHAVELSKAAQDQEGLKKHTKALYQYVEKQSIQQSFQKQDYSTAAFSYAALAKGAEQNGLHEESQKYYEKALGSVHHYTQQARQTGDIASELGSYSMASAIATSMKNKSLAGAYSQKLTQIAEQALQNPKQKDQVKAFLHHLSQSPEIDKGTQNRYATLASKY